MTSTSSTFRKVEKMYRILIMLAIVLWCCDPQKPQAVTNNVVDKSPLTVTPFDESKAVRLFSSEQVIVFSDPSIDSTKLWAMVKVDPYIGFEDFAVPVDFKYVIVL
jgi:hypothetical protein